MSTLPVHVEWCEFKGLSEVVDDSNCGLIPVLPVVLRFGLLLLDFVLVGVVDGPVSTAVDESGSQSEDKEDREGGGRQCRDESELPSCGEAEEGGSLEVEDAITGSQVGGTETGDGAAVEPRRRRASSAQSPAGVQHGRRVTEVAEPRVVTKVDGRDVSEARHGSLVEGVEGVPGQVERRQARHRVEQLHWEAETEANAPKYSHGLFAEHITNPPKIGLSGPKMISKDRQIQKLGH